MARGRVLRALVVETDGGAATFAREPSDQIPLPTLDQRANFYLRAVYGDRDYTNEDCLYARNLILNAMAADISERSDTPLPDSPSLPENRTTHRPIEYLANGQSSLPERSQTLPHRRRLSPFSTGPVAKRIAAACAAGAVALAAVLVLAGIFPTAWLPWNTPSHDAPVVVQATPPEPSSRTPSNIEFRIAAAQRELESALNSAPLQPADIAVLLKRGQDLIADGKFRLARLVLEQAVEAGSAPAALAIARTYDPSQPERSKVSPDAPPDIAMARAWYQKAKDLGSAEAARRLGQLLPGTAPSRPK